MEPLNSIRARLLGPEAGLVAMSLIWGINFPVIKTALPVLPPLAFNALRFPMAGIGIAVLLWASRKARLPDREDLWTIVWLGLVANVGYQVLFIVGLERTTAGNASILLATLPAWTTILSTLMGHEQIPPRVWVGVVGALAGIPLVTAGSFGISADTLTGDLLILGSAVTWAVYTVGAKSVIQKYGAMPVTAWTLWIGTVALVLIGLPSLQTVELSSLSLGAWAAVAYAGVFSIAIAYALWNRGVKAIGNARTAIYQNTVPVVVLVAAWVWLGEVPNALQLVGATLIIVSVSWAKRPSRAPVSGGPRETRREESPRP